MGLEPGAALSATEWSPFALLQLSKGDLAIIGAAMLYTMHVVRLGHWASRTTPLKLASAKAVVQAILSIGLIGVLLASTTFVDALPGFSGILLAAQAAGHEIFNFCQLFWKNLVAGDLAPILLGKIAGATLWSGVIGTAYVLYAQSAGQRSVRPSDANLVYSLQPIFTAAFAYFFLGETMNQAGFFGGGLILASVYLVASKTFSGTKRPQAVNGQSK